jgi:hypothetical protein
MQIANGNGNGFLDRGKASGGDFGFEPLLLLGGKIDFMGSNIDGDRGKRQFGGFASVMIPHVMPRRSRLFAI